MLSLPSALPGRGNRMGEPPHDLDRADVSRLPAKGKWVFFLLLGLQFMIALLAAGLGLETQ